MITSAARLGLVATVLALLGGCGGGLISNTSGSGTYAKGGIIPATNIQVSPTSLIPLEKIIYWAGVGAIAYYVVDPGAPNWQIEEAKFPDDHYHLSLKMKRYYAGGAGEARMVFNRRAEELARAEGFSGYKVVEYSESLESSVIGSQRTGQGVIVLTGKASAQSKG